MADSKDGQKKDRVFRIPDNARALEKLIRHHQQLYYNGVPEITDSEFDSLWDKLRELDPENPLFSEINSEAGDGFPKEYHLIPMGSQDKAADPGEFYAWAAKMKFSEFIVEYKLDGASIELQYENGEFIKGVTRGDGRIGDDITFNVSQMAGVVKTLPGEYGPTGMHPFSGGVRGEVIMTRSVHRGFFSDKANCRNAANGLMKRKDGADCSKLTVICYDAASGMPGSPFTGYSPFADEMEKINWLAGCGFTTVPFKVCGGAEDVVNYRSHVMEIRPSLDYDIDGLVVKGMEIDPVDLSRSRPEKQIAFKFSLEEAVSVLREVEWSESGATYTPVAKIDPVRLAGTTVRRASLANPNIISDLGLKIGSHVLVTKRGEIIPKIIALVENPPDASEIPVPEKCSVCQTELCNEGTRLYCPNDECPKLILHRLEKWISVLSVRDFGENLLRRLFEKGMVRSISDLYTLTVEQLADIDRMGKISAAKVLRSLHSKKKISLSAFIAGFDIEGIGETMTDKLVQSGFDSLDKFFNASAEDFAAVYQFGPVLAGDLFSALKKLRPEMEKVVEVSGITITTPVTAGGAFLGKSFCFTGELLSMKRQEAEKLIRDLGGQAKSSVTKDLSYLVTNNPESGSSKNKRAAELGIPVLSENDFLELVKKAEKTVSSSEKKTDKALLSSGKKSGNNMQMELGIDT